MQEKADRKRKKKALRKQRQEERRLEAMIGTASNSNPSLKAASPLARAIHEYTKMLMGMPRKNPGSDLQDPTLPEPPTDEEHQAWKERKSRRQKLMTDAIEKAKRKYLLKHPAGFKPNKTQIRTLEKDTVEKTLTKHPMQPVQFNSRISSNFRFKYSPASGSQCEGALALAGFPRCTFDWGASPESPWNSSTSSIILEQWVKCYNLGGAGAYPILEKDNTPENRQLILKRWLENKSPQYRTQTKRANLMKTPEGRQTVANKDANAASMASKRRGKDKIYKARMSVVDKLFGAESPEAGLFSHLEVHSDNEITNVNGRAFRHRVRVEWRSAKLDQIIGLIDRCIAGRETVPKAKRRAKELTNRGPYSSTPDEDQFPPKRFQKSLVSELWYNRLQGVTAHYLELNDTDIVDIDQAIHDLTNLCTLQNSQVNNMQTQ